MTVDDHRLCCVDCKHIFCSVEAGEGYLVSNNFCPVCGGDNTKVVGGEIEYFLGVIEKLEAQKKDMIYVYQLKSFPELIEILKKMVEVQVGMKLRNPKTAEYKRQEEKLKRLQQQQLEVLRETHKKAPFGDVDAN